MKLYWIFARTPFIQEQVVKRIDRRIRELSDGQFKILPISAVIRDEVLNPFESSVSLRTTTGKEPIMRRNSFGAEDGMCPLGLSTEL